MPPVPTTSPRTSLPVHPSYVHTTHGNFVDSSGRTLLFRGVNLSGASKAPVNHLSHQLDDFWSSAEAGGESFIGRPLKLEDGSADIHLARLRGWGFNLLRFPITWEALEHEGPGKYDYEFMDYTIRVLLKCKEYGFRVYLDPHQDTWSRFSGGSGAPFWTLPACGIDPLHITPTQSAIVHCEYPYAHAPDPASLPAMIWSTNYGRLLSQTLFTLFFAGRTFAPNCIIDGVNIQDWLQGHYIEAFGQLSDRIRQWDDSLEEGSAEKLYDECIIGWDSLNEPFEGLCGWENLNANPTAQGSTLKKGTYPTPAQSMRLGMGQVQTVENWSFGVFGPQRNGSVTIDPKGMKVWAEASVVPAVTEEGGDHHQHQPTQPPSQPPQGELPNGHHPRWGWKRDTSKWPLGTCIWALHNVWDIETGYVLRPDYFKYHPALVTESTSDEEEGHELERIEVEFITDFWKPHWVRWKTRLEKSHPEAIWFVQPPVFAKPPAIGEGGDDEEEEDHRSLLDQEERLLSPKLDSDDVTPTTESTAAAALAAVNTTSLGVSPSSGLHGRCCYSTHYYDGLTLITRHWNWFNADALGVLRGKYASPIAAVKVGNTAIRKSIREQLGILKSDAELLGDQSKTHSYPTVIGEIGIPFDMDSKRAYGWTNGGKHRGDYTKQVEALDASLQATEGVNVDGMSWTVWTFCGDDHSHEWGDGWNLEDLSLFSVGDVWGAGPGEKGQRRAIMEDTSSNSSRGSLVNSKDQQKKKPKKKKGEQMKPSLAMVAAASSLSVATLGSVDGSSTLGGGSGSLSASSSRSSLKPTSTPPSPIPPPVVPVAASSTTGTSTPNVDDDSPKPSRAVLSRLGWHANPFDFLVDGARAWQAFNRPFPVKCVGVPKDMEFDIKKGVWKLNVVVGWEDKPTLLGEEGGAENKVLGTEIYVPLVHYAHPRLLSDKGGKKRRRRVAGKKVVDSSSSSSPDSTPGSTVPPSASDSLVSLDGPAFPPGLEGTSALVVPSSVGIVPVVGAVPMLGRSRMNHPYRNCNVGVCPSQVTLGAQPVVPYLDDDGYDSDMYKDTGVEDGRYPYEDDDEETYREEEGREGEDGEVDWESGPLVDLEVTVSEGTWRVEGQALFWYYDTPQKPEERDDGEEGLNSSSVSSSNSSSSLNLASSAREAQMCQKMPGGLSASTLNVAATSSRKPKSGGDGEEEGKKEVWIEIRRRGGPVKKEIVEWRKKLALSAAGGGGKRGNGVGGGDGEIGKDKVRDGNWCEEFSRQGCLVM